MKALILISILSINCFVFAGEPLTYSDIIQVDSTVSTDDLFTRAITWVNSAYKSPQDIISLKDKDAGHISLKPLIVYNSSVFGGSESTKGTIRYTVDIFIKQGRYKYEVTNFIHTAYPSNAMDYSFGLITTDEEMPQKIKNMGANWCNKVWRDIKNNCLETSDILISSLKSKMSVKSSAEGDW